MNKISSNKSVFLFLFVSFFVFVFCLFGFFLYFFVCFVYFCCCCCIYYTIWNISNTVMNAKRLATCVLHMFIPFFSYFVIRNSCVYVITMCLISYVSHMCIKLLHNKIKYLFYSLVHI